MLYHQLLCELHKVMDLTTNQRRFQLHDTKSHPNSPQSTETISQSISQQLYNLQQQVRQIHLIQMSQEKPQRHKPHKPETRVCFRCEQYGHVAKYCRSRPSPNQYFQQTTENTFSKNRRPLDNDTVNSYIQQVIIHLFTTPCIIGNYRL